MQNCIYYAENDNIIYIKAKGHITAHICYGLRQKVFDRLTQKPKINNIYTDLSSCEYMDSTFMGLLIGFNKKLFNLFKKKLCIIHPSPESLSYLTDIGLDKILSYSNKEIPFPENMAIISQEDAISPEFILKAHENLMELSEDNRKQFKIVKELLTKQINKNRNKKEKKDKKD